MSEFAVPDTEKTPRVRSKAASASGAVCDLCGLALEKSRTNGQGHQFCCPGCRQVFAILADAEGRLSTDFRQSALYRTCVETGLIPSAQPPPSQSSKAPETEYAGASLELQLGIKGMWCPACAWVIAEVLKRRTGVLEPKVSFFTDTVRLRYLPHLVSPVEIASTIRKLGYRIASTEEERHEGVPEGKLLVRLIVSSILTMNAMMLAFALYSGFFHQLSGATVAYLSYPLAAMTAPVVFWGGMPIFRKAWGALKVGSISMETLISLSALAAFFDSLMETVRGGIHIYYDTASMLVTIVLLGRYVETRSRARIAAPLVDDGAGMGKTRLVGATGPRWVASEAVQPGNTFMVEAGERIPIDGRVVSGRALIDQSFITGELTPLEKQIHDSVAAGNHIVDGTLTMVAMKSARESSFRQMTDLITEALERKNSAEELADSISRYFVPAVIAVAAVTAGILAARGVPGQTILLRCLTIMLISCPCALGIATPLVKVAIIGLGRKQGILVKNHEALERIGKVDTVVLDKTGTVTEGRFTMRRIVCGETEEKEALSMVSAVETNSSHLLAGKIIQAAADLGISPVKASQNEEVKGMGITGIVSGRTVFAGNRGLLARYDVQLPHHLHNEAVMEEEKGMTVVFFGWEKKTMGFFVFGDALREGTTKLLQWLSNRGSEVLLLSGDSKRTTGACARAMGIARFLGEALPREKLQVVKDLQSKGRVVAVAGDGINDAGALAQADVGFAMGSGHNMMNEAADFIIPSGNPAKIVETFRLAALSKRKVRQNLIFAFFYNVIAIPVAAMGLLNPLVAVLLMSVSSLTVIGNVLHATRTGEIRVPGRLLPAGP